MAFEPLKGWREVTVSKHRRKQEFALVLQCHLCGSCGTLSPLAEEEGDDRGADGQRSGKLRDY
jgi:hypothetical protein